MAYGTPALLFGAIALIMLAYTNRFFVLAKLVRDIHSDKSETNYALNIKQIPSLRLRLRLIQVMQALGVLSFIFCSFSMFCLFVDGIVLGKIMFGIAIVCLLLSLLVSLWEVLISTKALNMVLEDLLRKPR